MKAPRRISPRRKLGVFFQCEAFKEETPAIAGKGTKMPNNLLHNENHKRIAQKLRAEQTEEERKLWYCFLRKLPVKVLRQQTIGDYIVDFYCASAKLVIELDGIQHYSEEGQSKDDERDRYLNNLGITVVRYTNLDVQRKFSFVCMDIKSRLNIE